MSWNQNGVWEHPYPAEEQKARFICDDPIAVAYGRLEDWVKAQKFKPPVNMNEVVDCLAQWQRQKTGRTANTYEIIRGQIAIPMDIPDEIYRASRRLFDVEDL